MPNSPANKPIIPILTGPTGSGKSAIVTHLLESNAGLNIISADSRQIYKYLDIGTDKPSIEERRKFKFHLIDRVEPGDRYSAFDFVRETLDLIDRLTNKGEIPLICGGTGLYIKALAEGIVEIPENDYSIRARLENDAVEKGPKYLFQKLEKIDPVEAQKTHPHNLRRIIRALEIFEITGLPKSKIIDEGQVEESRYDYKIVCLLPARDQLYERINLRVDRMMASGLLKEVENLCRMGLKDRIKGINVIGYNELFDYLDGRISLEGGVNLIKQNSRRFAKRQITWLRGMKKMIFMVNPREVEQFLAKIID